MNELIELTAGGESVTTLNIDYSHSLSSSLLVKLLEYLCNLKHLRIPHVRVYLGGSIDDQLGHKILENLEILSKVNYQLFQSLLHCEIQTKRVTIECNEKESVTSLCKFLANQRNLQHLSVVGVHGGMYYRGNVFKIFRELNEMEAKFNNLTSLSFAWEKRDHYFSDFTNIEYFNRFLERQSNTLEELELKFRHIPLCLVDTIISKLRLRKLSIVCGILDHVFEEKPKPNLNLKDLIISIGSKNSEAALDSLFELYPTIENLTLHIVEEESSYFNSLHLSNKYYLMDERILKKIADRLRSLKSLNLRNIVTASSKINFLSTLKALSSPECDNFTPPSSTCADIQFSSSLKSLFFRCGHMTISDNILNIKSMLNGNSSIEKLHIEFYREIICESQANFFNLDHILPAVEHLVNLTELSILVWYATDLKVEINTETRWKEKLKNLKLIRIIYRGNSKRKSALSKCAKNKLSVFEFNHLDDSSLSQMLLIDENVLKFQRVPDLPIIKRRNLMEHDDPDLVGMMLFNQNRPKRHPDPLVRP